MEWQPWRWWPGSHLIVGVGQKETLGTAAAGSEDAGLPALWLENHTFRTDLQERAQFSRDRPVAKSPAPQTLQ